MAAHKEIASHKCLKTFLILLSLLTAFVLLLGTLASGSFSLSLNHNADGWVPAVEPSSVNLASAKTHLSKQKEEPHAQVTSELFINRTMCTGPPAQGIKSSHGFVGPFKYLPNYKNPCWVEAGQLKCVPYFYLIGAYKAGTTKLFQWLTLHPQVVKYSRKEYFWFILMKFIGQTFKHYIDAFANETKVVENSVDPQTGQHNMIFGNGSPANYAGTRYWRRIPANSGCPEPLVTTMSQIHHLWPKAKILLILRNPADRIYSMYNFQKNVTQPKYTSEEFHSWVVEAITKFKDCLETFPPRRCYYDYGFVEDLAIMQDRNFPRVPVVSTIYVAYVEDLLKIFPRNQVIVFRFEDLKRNSTDVLHRAFQFLGLDPLPRKTMDEMVHENFEYRGHVYPKIMWPKTRELINQFFAPYNRQLSNLLQDERFMWNDM